MPPAIWDLTSEMAKEGKGPLPLLTQAVEAPMRMVAPEPAAKKIGAYATFVAPRVSAQLSASAIGSVASYRWVRDQCQANPREASARELENGGARSPEAYVAAGAVFAVPALLATSRGAALLARKLGQPRAAYVPAVLIPTSCVVADEAVVQANEWVKVNPGRRSPAH